MFASKDFAKKWAGYLLIATLLLLPSCAHRPNISHLNHAAVDSSPPRKPGQWIDSELHSSPQSRWADGSESDGLELNGEIGTIDPYLISTKIEDNFVVINRCFEDYTANRPYVGGELTIKLEIDQSGYPKKAYLEESTLGAYVVESCILDRVKSLHYAKPRGGRIAHATVPFKFRAEAPASRAYIDEHLGTALDQGLSVVDEDTGETVEVRAYFPIVVTAYVDHQGVIVSYGLSWSGHNDMGRNDNSLPDSFHQLIRQLSVDDKGVQDRQSADIKKYIWTLGRNTQPVAGAQ